MRKIFLSISVTCLYLTGCSSLNKSKLEDNLLDSDLVKQNAELAIRQCGKGNVKKVDVSGFLCKKPNLTP